MTKIITLTSIGNSSPHHTLHHHLTDRAVRKIMRALLFQNTGGCGILEAFDDVG
jgi:hypothetical protein